MLQQATLGGVKGAADLKWRQRDAENREWRGTFVFRKEDEPVIAQLVDGHAGAVYESVIDGEKKRLRVTLSTFSPIGLAFFEGSGNPY